MQTRADYTTVDHQQSGRHEEPFHTAALWKRCCVPKKRTGAHNDPTQIGNISLKHSHCASVMESQKMFQWKMSTCLEHCCPPRKVTLELPSIAPATKSDIWTSKNSLSPANFQSRYRKQVKSLFQWRSTSDHHPTSESKLESDLNSDLSRTETLTLARLGLNLSECPKIDNTHSY